METTYKFIADVPYSLHDMRINKIECINQMMKLSFENGFLSMKEPHTQVDGHMVIEGIDEDFCFAYLLSKNGNNGSFQGQKLEFKDFLKVYPNFQFEVVNESYGYNMVIYNGYLILPNQNDFIECTLVIYHFGNIIFITNKEE